MVHLDDVKSLRQQIANWSDEHLAEARAFVAAHARLIPRDLTNSQLNGLASVARSAKKAADIRRFLAHQATKAERADKSQMRECWQALQKKLDEYHHNANAIARQLHSRWEVDEIYFQLVRRFIQHLIAEHAMKAACAAADREREAGARKRKFSKNEKP